MTEIKWTFKCLVEILEFSRIVSGRPSGGRISQRLFYFVAKDGKVNDEQYARRFLQNHSQKITKFYREKAELLEIEKLHDTPQTDEFQNFLGKFKRDKFVFAIQKALKGDRHFAEDKRLKHIYKISEETAFGELLFLCLIDVVANRNNGNAPKLDKVFFLGFANYQAAAKISIEKTKPEKVSKSSTANFRKIDFDNDNEFDWTQVRLAADYENQEMLETYLAKITNEIYLHKSLVYLAQADFFAKSSELQAVWHNYFSRMKNPRYKALILIDCMVLGYFAAHREELFAHIKDIRNATHVYNVLEFMALDLELYEEVRIYSEYLDKKYTRDYRRELDELIKVGGGKMS